MDVQGYGLTAHDRKALADLGPFTNKGDTEYAVLYTTAHAAYTDDVGILLAREDADGLAETCCGVVVRRTAGSDWSIAEEDRAC